MTNKPTPSDASVLKEYFGLKEGQGLADFVAEIKKLTPEDKAELVELAKKELHYA